MKYINQKIKNISVFVLFLFFTITQFPTNAFASEKTFKADSFSNSLDSGFYSGIKIDATKVYEAGLKAGKANSTVNIDVNSIIVDPGDYGAFESDGNTSKKVFNSSNMSTFTMDVTPVDVVHIFDKWSVSFENNSVIYTAKWTYHSPEYNFTPNGKYSNTGAQQFTAPVTGKYQITLYGAQGNPNGYCEYPSCGRPRGSVGKGGMTQGIISLTKGDVLYVYAGIGYACASDVRLKQNDESTRIMVAAAGGEAAGYTLSLSGGNGGGLTGGSGGGSTYRSGLYATIYGGTQTGTICSSDGVSIATNCGNVSNDYNIYVAGGYKYNPNARTYGLGSYYNGSRMNYVEAAGGGSSYISGYSGCDTYSDKYKFTNATMSAGCHSGLASATIKVLSAE